MFTFTKSPFLQLSFLNITGVIYFVLPKYFSWLSNFLLKSGLPILGICYGLQLLVHHTGGIITSKDRGEYGSSKVIFDTDNCKIGELVNVKIKSFNQKNLFGIYETHKVKAA